MPESSFWSKPSAPPGLRIKSEAVENYQRNQGTLKSLAFHQDDLGTTLTSRPSPRCPTAAAKANYERNVRCSLDHVLNGPAAVSPRPSSAPPYRVKPEGMGIYSKSTGQRIKPIIHDRSSDGPTPRQPRVKPEAQGIATISQGTRIKPIVHEKCDKGPPPVQPRVKPEGEPIADVSKGPRMRILLNEFAKHGSSPRQPRVKAEGENNYEAAKGKGMNKVLHAGYGTLPIQRTAVPRVKREGGDNYSLDQGKRMDSIVHEYGKKEGTPRAAPRVKREGEDNYDLDRGKRMATVLHSFSLPLSSRPAPRVKREGEQSAELDRGGRMSRLMHEIQQTPSRSGGHLGSRVSGSPARRNWWKGKVGTLGKVLKQTAQKAIVYKPGERAKRV